MFNGKQIAQNVVMVVLMIIVVVVLVYLLTGCLGLEEKQEGRQQSLTISADFEAKTIDVQIDDDEEDDKQNFDLTK